MISDPMMHLDVLHATDGLPDELATVLESEYGVLMQLIDVHTTVIHIRRRTLTMARRGAPHALSTVDAFTWHALTTDTAALASALAEAYECGGVIALRPESPYPANSKVWMLSRAARMGIAVPQSLIGMGSALSMALRGGEFNHEDLVVKLPRTTNGNGVFRATRESAAALLHGLDAPVIVQRWVENESDMRVLIFGGTTCGAIRRTRAVGFVNNTARGARGDWLEAHELSDDVLKIASNVGKVFGWRYAAADVVSDGDGAYLLEAGPWFQLFSGACVPEKVGAVTAALGRDTAEAIRTGRVDVQALTDSTTLSAAS